MSGSLATAGRLRPLGGPDAAALLFSLAATNVPTPGVRASFVRTGSGRVIAALCQLTLWAMLAGSLLVIEGTIGSDNPVR